MSKQIVALADSVDRLVSEHTRLRVENQSLTLRVRELERQAAASGEKVQRARARLDALIAQLPLEAAPDAMHTTPPPTQRPLL